MSSKPDTSRNEWFTKDEPSYKVEGDVNKQNMGVMFDKMKEQQNTAVLSRYRGVETLSTNSGPSSKLYEDNNDEYVQCDPFSKLKYDDLRKVHKDQTVLAVSEKDISKIPLYKSTEQYMQARGEQPLNPLDKDEAEKMLEIQNQQYKQNMTVNQSQLFPSFGQEVEKVPEPNLPVPISESSEIIPQIKSQPIEQINIVKPPIFNESKKDKPTPEIHNKKYLELNMKYLKYKEKYFVAKQNMISQAEKDKKTILDLQNQLNALKN
jgi:hypothetical protein